MSITLLIVILTVIVSYKGFTDRGFFEQLKHSPFAESRNGEWHRMISSGFLHADWIHLGFNMFVLYEFGTMIEKTYLSQYGTVIGRVIYLLVYIVMIVLASLPSYYKHKNNPGYGAIGASGAVSGILFIFILFAPWSTLNLYFAIPIPAIIFGVLYLAYSSWASKNSRDNIGHDAHFYGAIAGMVITAILIPRTLSIFIQEFTRGLPF